MEALSLWKRLSGSSKQAVTTAYDFARENQRLASASDLLVGVSQQHYPDSPVLVLLKHFKIPEQALYDAVKYDPATSYSNIKSSFSPDNDLLKSGEFDPEAMHIIEASVQLGEKFNTRDKPPLARLSDLFGALLIEKTSAQSLLRQLLSTAQEDYDRIAAAYMHFLERPEEGSLADMLDQLIPRPDYVEPLQRAVSGFGSDTRADRDLVGIGAEIDAFAYLITARALQPPLAIGLFGDWGSGKTYFMQSLQERVHKITESARQSKEPQKNISVYKYVVQIEFNAWHYVEGELWASLVEHIFNNLQTSEHERPTLLEERQRVWAQKMEGKRREQREIEERKKKLEEELEEKQKGIEVLQDELKQKLEAKNRWETKDALNDIVLSEREKEQIQGLLDDMGITAAGQSSLDFYQALTELKDVLEQGSALGLVLRRRGWGWTARLALVLLSGPAISGLVVWASQNQFPAVTNALLGLSGFLSAATIVLRQGTAELSKVLVRVQEAQAQLEARRAEIEAEYAEKIEEIERAIAPIQAQYDQARDDEQKLTDQIAELEKEATEITPRRVLLDFIQERVGSQDYRRWLGIPALIRRDFDQLSRLIMDSNKKFVDEDTGGLKQEDIHNINRIVLYIDDLDRCPPDKVAKVLQAVHLLLAFPLFVVVVAVDARWLSQSLQKYYRGLLAANPVQAGETEGEDIFPHATPQDYLEKIFQVPFWVSSLSENARLSVVKGLVRQSLVQLSQVDEQVGKQSGKEKPARESVEESSVAASPGGGVSQPVFYESQPKQPLSTTPAGLEIEPDEVKFMEGLKPLLGLTPRSVRRFVNVYWLIKSIALAQPKHTAFINQEVYADYKQVLFLLSVLTGLPEISHDFFSLLCPGPLKGLDQAECPQKNLQEIIDNLQGLIYERGKLGAGIFGAQRDLDRLKQWASNSETDWLSISTEKLSVWAPQVARFSYRMEHV